MALWDDSPAALGLTVERALRDASTSSAALLPEGWILRLIDKGHSLDRLASFLDAVLHAGMRVATSNTFASLPPVDAYLGDLHAQQSRVGSTKGGVCGYMFKNNDIAWNCRTCQMDDTCVLCQPCFQNSDHAGHEVFFHRTSPGGMCDCGDVEAWKPEGFCKDHTGAPSEPSALTEPLLPPAMERVFQCIFRDFVGFITCVAQHSASSFDDFKVAENGDAIKRKHFARATSTGAAGSPPLVPATTNPAIFHTRISNDDVHTDDELVRCLSQMGFNEGFAEEFTRSVDRRGCGTLKADVTLAEALNWMRQMKEAGNWFASVVDNYHIANEVAWGKLYEYLAPLLAASPAVQAILFEQLFALYATQDGPNAYQIPTKKAPLTVLLQATPFVKKELVNGMKQLYLAIMGSKQLKMQFAPIYVTVFPKLMMQYFGGMGTERENVFGLGVQIFTTPSIVHQLEDDMGLWEVVLTTLQDAMSLAKVPVDPLPGDSFTYSVQHMAIKYRRYFPLLQDINHLLMLPTMAIKFATTCASLFFSVLNDASHMNLQTRVPEGRAHVEREDNAAWIAAFTLVMHLDSLVLPNLYKSLQSQTTSVDGVLWTLCDAFLASLQDFASSARLVYHEGEPSLTDQYSMDAPFIKYSVASQPVSFHYPLHQAWGRFLLEMIQRNCFRELQSRLSDGRLVDAVLEFPLRSLVWSSQIASNMWVRNGKDMMVRQVTSYYSLSSNLSFRDLDLVTVQTCLVLMGPARFLTIFLDRYDILPYLTSTTAQSTWLHNVSMEKRAMYVAECLLKLIWIANELPPVPTLPIAGYLRRDVLHMILVKPRVFSYLRDQTNPIYCNPALVLTSDDTKNRELMTLLKEIADIQPTTASNQDMAPSKFTLKPQLYHEYDPAFFHESPVHHVEAQVARQDVVFKTWTEKSDPIPMVHQLQPGHPDLLACRDVLMEDGVFRLLRLCLNDPLLQTDDNVYSRILHILTLQLYMVHQDDKWTDVVRGQLGRSPDEGDHGDGSKRQKINHSALGPGSIHSCSILARLAARANQFKTQETIQKPLWSATLFVLKGYLKAMDGNEDDLVASYVATHVFPTQVDGAATSGAPAMDAKARLALQKKRQQEALAKMMAQQSNFAAQIESDDEDDLNSDDRSTDSTSSVIPPPECNICAHSKRADDPVVYVGLLQESTLRNRSTGLDRSHGQALHAQLCRHAVHLSCLQEYTSTMRRETFLGAHSQIAFDSQAGEFLCPLCKALCNTCVPFVASPPTFASSMEQYFQHALDADAVTTWLTTALPGHIRRYFSEDGAVPAAGSTVMPSAIETFLVSASALRDSFQSAQKGFRPVEVLLDTVSSVFHLSQLQGLSAGFCLMDLHNRSSLPSLPTRLASMFSSDSEALVDPFGPQDDAKLHAIFMMLMQIKDVIPADSSLVQIDRFGLDPLFRLDAVPVSRDAYFLNKPLLEHDLFTLLLLVCSGMRDKADMLWAIRVFCSLHLTQVLLQSTKSLGISQDITNNDAGVAVPEASPYAALRDQLVALTASTPHPIAISPTAPSGALLHYLVEANLSEFLRKATLLARAIFQGWNDPDAAQYLNFASSLRLSTDVGQLCTQLGAMSSSTFLDPTKFQAWSVPIAHYISQMRLDHVPPLSFLVKEDAVWAAHVPVVRLAPLYTDQYTATASSVCAATGLVQESPAICLLCGTAVCGGTDCCKLPEYGNRGGCSRHASACVAGNGAYFLTRQCQMLLVSSGGRSSFFASPYVDEFGEEDHMVRRGRPLFLRPKRYMALMQLVWSHGIATEVSKNRRTSEQFIRPYFY
ncbi:hypothetical protein, variant [Aphanomyces invadans]|uniref:E3 ubiquitin-protein ligase n=1 Tax=Aphanomyces invadans TaxID=157072 RepID=A0A024UP32_9STRA|nr:hypothetical protein, variant [Aphanomyces invadans]ETW07910.1 hypothetical protein, variant [Aphanomyces invadans]|eukprot:XP_008864003.1 hypothetical protein, variant [Aphanomyces invadans]